MNVLQKEKNELLKWIENIDDPKILADIRSVKESQKSIDWDELPKEVKKGIEEGRKDAKEGRVTSHEEVRRSYEEWL